jgi:hypothetical protein
MTAKIVEETSSTSFAAPVIAEETATTQSAAGEPLRVARSGHFLAGLVLSAALLASNPALAFEAVTSRSRRRDSEAAETSVDIDAPDAELIDQIRELFEKGSSEFFVDGVHSSFSRGLMRVLQQRGAAALRAIAEYLAVDDASPEVISEALRWLGDFGDEETLRHRWVILQRTIRHRSARVRDGAIIGFAAMDQPQTKSILIEARDREPVTELKRLIEQVLQQLDMTEDAAAADRGSRKPLA